jgi:hypothetical protein
MTNMCSQSNYNLQTWCILPWTGLVLHVSLVGYICRDIAHHRGVVFSHLASYAMYTT